MKNHEVPKMNNQFTELEPFSDQPLSVLSNARVTQNIITNQIAIDLFQNGIDLPQIRDVLLQID